MTEFWINNDSFPFSVHDYHISLTTIRTMYYEIQGLSLICEGRQIKLSKHPAQEASCSVLSGMCLV